MQVPGCRCCDCVPAGPHAWARCSKWASADGVLTGARASIYGVHHSGLGYGPMALSTRGRLFAANCLLSAWGTGVSCTLWDLANLPEPCPITHPWQADFAMPRTARSQVCGVWSPALCSCQQLLRCCPLDKWERLLTRSFRPVASWAWPTRCIQHGPASTRLHSQPAASPMPIHLPHALKSCHLHMTRL